MMVFCKKRARKEVNVNLNYIDLRKTICSFHKMDFSNKEWLYMLGEETRHSVSIEGIFSDEKVLKNIKVIVP
jgi:hypothetical protein